MDEEVETGLEDDSDPGEGGDGQSDISCLIYPRGKAIVYSRGDAAWAKQAWEALTDSLVFLPAVVGKLYFHELERRGVPLEVAVAYVQNTHVLDETYTRLADWEKPP